MYKVQDKILDNYAKVMVHFALNGGEGIKRGETVWLVANECSGDLFHAIRREIYKAGGNVIERFLPNDTDRYGLNPDIIRYGSDEQLKFFPEACWKGVIDSSDHLLFILAQHDVHKLEGLSSAKIKMKNSNTNGPIMTMRAEKEKLGKQFWTLCLYGTESAAKEAGLTLEEYWQQIIDACFLNEEDPVAKWKEIQAEIVKTRDWLTGLQIDEVHVKGADIDLRVKIGEQRKFLAGRGHNIPSFEVFTSPDWRGTNGWVSFNQPLYYSGKKINGIKLEFKDGVITAFSATENQDALEQMISAENANKLGEFSLTDRRHSNIQKFMAHTLFDENTGGAFGNTHVAVGNSYRDAYDGEQSDISEEEWGRLGFNNCPPVHVDMVSTSNRSVVATLKNGRRIMIYTDGEFQMEHEVWLS